jgi:hypothetical protein
VTEADLSRVIEALSDAPVAGAAQE